MADKIAILELLSYGNHLYATLFFEGERLELEHIISTKEAIDLNKADRRVSYKKGAKSRRFGSLQRAERVAIDKAKEIGATKVVDEIGALIWKK